MQQETAVVTVKTLLLTDLVDSTSVVEKLGDRNADRVFRRHERIARDLLRQHHGIEIDKSDGFLLVFNRPLDAVNYALNYHLSLKKLSDDVGLEIKARAGIHRGELILRKNDPTDVARGAKPKEAEGLAEPTAARLMSLALPRQLLLSRGAFDLARRAAVGEEPGLGKLEWLNHGAYQFKGIEDPVEPCCRYSRRAIVDTEGMTVQRECHQDVQKYLFPCSFDSALNGAFSPDA